MANNYYLDFNVTGAELGRLIEAISGFTGADPIPLEGADSDCVVDLYRIDKSGTVLFGEEIDREEIDSLLDTLVNNGFVPIVSSIGCDEESEDL